MSNVKFMEMEDIAYKEWSDHLDLVASSKANPWLPAYGYQPPSPVQEMFQSPSPGDGFLSDNSSVNQQQYLVLETIVEETSDDLCSESDKSNPTGWNSDSDTDSVIHLPKLTENADGWRLREGNSDEVPKKRRRRFVDKFCASDDDEPIESNSLSSRSSSLIAFESLEKHCEDILVGTGVFDRGDHDATRWTNNMSPDSPRESVDEFDSSDEENIFNNSTDIFHRSRSVHSTFRESLPSDLRLRSYRSFDSLNLFESVSPINYTLSELSQSQSALDYEKEKQQEKDFVIRDKKLTATTADLSRMTDPYDGGVKALGFKPRRRQDVASFHYKESVQYRNANSPLMETVESKRKSFPSKRKSYSAEALKLQIPQVECGPKDSAEVYGRSDPCLSIPQKSHPSVENLSEDSGFDDPMSSNRGKMNLVNFRNSVSSIPEDGDASPLESSSSNFSDCNGSEEGSMAYAESRDNRPKTETVNVVSSKIDEKREGPEQESGSIAIKDDVEFKFNSDQIETHTLSFSGIQGESFPQRESQKLIVSESSVPFASLDSHGSLWTTLSDSDSKKCLRIENSLNKLFPTKEAENESSVRNNFTEFPFGRMNTKLEKGSGGRLPVVSTPNLLQGVDEFVRGISLAATSLTHVPLKCYDEDDLDDPIIRNNLLNYKKNQFNSGFGRSQSSTGIKGVHFCPIVSEVSWQDSYSEVTSSSSSLMSNASSNPSTDELSNRSLEELYEMENDEEDFHEVEEKRIPRDQENETESQRAKASSSDVWTQKRHIAPFKSNSELNLSRTEKEDAFESGALILANRKRNFVAIDSKPSNIVNISSNKCEPCVVIGDDYERGVTPTIRITPISSGHVVDGDAAQPNAERRIWLSVSESNLPAQGHASIDRYEIDGRASSNSANAAAMAMKKSKSRFGGFFERFSLRRLSNRKSSGGNLKKQNCKEKEKKGKDDGDSLAFGATTSSGQNTPEDVLIIPLHAPAENEAEVKEIFRSVVSPHVVSAKPPLPPNFQRMSGPSRKRLPISQSVGSQDDETNGKENNRMPGVRENVSKNSDRVNGSLIDGECDAELRAENREKPVGLLETDLDTEITVESAGSRPLAAANVGTNKKARSLMNLGLGEMSIHSNHQENHTSQYLEPTNLRNHGSVAVDDRAKSMEFLLDKENQAAILPPENELQKGGTSERVMSEHQLRVQRSLQKLNIPDWYKSSAVSQTPQGFLLKRNSDAKREQGWPGLGSKTTSLSSLGSSQSATARSPTSQILSPSLTPHLFTRWSTSRLSSGLNSSSTSPSSSARSSFNYRQPYLGWRSQEKLTRPRTPAERLAAGLLPLQPKQQHQQQTTVQTNSQSSINLSDVRTSIKEVTSAIVHYVSGAQENGSKEALRTYHVGISPSPSPKRRSSPKGSSGKLCWLESSFVGSRPVDQPETPLTLTEPSSSSSASAAGAKSEMRTNEPYLELSTPSEHNIMNSHRMNEGASRVTERQFEVGKRPSPTSTTLNDILDSLLGLPLTSRSPSPGRSRPPPLLSDSQLQKQNCGDLRANSSESASDPENVEFAKEVMNRRRKSDGAGNDGGQDLSRKNHGDQKDKRSLSHGNSRNEEVGPKKDHLTHPAPNTLVKCRYSKCGKTATISEAKKTFKTCHNCSHVYCSRECRRAHWERHRRICLHSRVGALCRQVLSAAKEDPRALNHLSLLARRGYLTHGRGAVKIFFSSPEMAEKFVAKGFDELGEPAYVKWSDLLPAEMGADLFAELMKICKSYNPDTRLVLYVAVCVVSEVPTTGAVKWERQIVSRCCKIPLEKSLAVPKKTKHQQSVPPPLPPRKSSSDCINITRDMENPETLILTSLPGIAGQVPEQKIREISFVNIQRELKQRGVSLRRQFPEIFKKLCSYVEGTSEHFTPVTIFPKDVISGKTFMCIIMPDSEPEKLQLVPKDSTRVQTIDVSIERKLD